MAKISKRSWILFSLSILLYGYVTYDVARFDTTSLFICVGVLFLSYYGIIRSVDGQLVDFWIKASIAFRICLLFALPNLSDDFYRFIWDGRLLAAGYHPFAELPRYYIEHRVLIPGIDQELFEKLNSPDYFTIYPPVHQFIFWLSVKLSFGSILGSVMVMRGLIIAAEIGSIFLIKRILEQAKLPAKNVLLYALNPLVILELTGNLHFEAFMIFFLLLSLWFLMTGKWILSAIQFALAICSKLIPVILLPLWISRLGIKRSAWYYFITGSCCLLLFLPLLNSEIISGFRESIGYYFKKFEFNASLYYLVREWGFSYYGYNIVQTVGWKMALYCTLAILVYSGFDYRWQMKSRSQSLDEDAYSIDFIRPDRLSAAIVFVFSIYFIFSTTVHPWYITTLVAFSAMTVYRFAIVWSALIFLTYSGYAPYGFKENLWLTAIEYVLVIGYLAYEIRGRKYIQQIRSQE